MSLDDLKREALKLPGDEQLELAYSLIRNVRVDDDEEPELERQWAQEGERRYQAYLEGKLEAVPGDEAIQRIRAKLK